MKRKINKKNTLLLIIMLLLFMTSIISLYRIITYLKDNRDNKNIQETIIKKSITIIAPTKEKEDMQYNVDFNSLKETNEDTVAYLKVNGTNIDYIVVRGNDNSYYLNHNFENRLNVSGWIFSDYHNKFDGTDKNIVIYGHNTKDGSMFGTLKNVLDKNWQNNEENTKIILVTELGTHYYEVFSTYSIKAEDYYINTSFDNDNFNEFIEVIKSRTTHDYNVEVNENDKILTLSSCIGDGTNRVVLHSKLIDN